ncbi:MAG: UvrB/UvrC motif-containing protein [Candidatus Omnitrophota bacterium]
MICDVCSKKDATVHLTEIIDNKITKLHLCEDCARKKGAEMEEHFGLSDLLAGLADFESKAMPKKEAKAKCPKCGMVYDDFKKAGRLGCAECYNVFSDSLKPLIKRVHGSVEHYGKTPISRFEAKVAPKKEFKKKKVADDIDELKGQLQRAVKMEEFEEAACIRDKIREMEKKEVGKKK